MKGKLIEIFGWYGAVAILGAYALASFEVLEPTSLIFQLLNVTGAFGIGVVSLYKRVYQSVVLNIVWAIVAIVVILNLLF